MLIENGRLKMRRIKYQQIMLLVIVMILTMPWVCAEKKSLHGMGEYTMSDYV